MIVYITNFFFAKKKKLQKEVGKYAAWPLSVRLCALSAQHYAASIMLWIYLQKLNAVYLILPKTVELSKISAIFASKSFGACQNFDIYAPWALPRMVIKIYSKHM